MAYVEGFVLPVPHDKKDAYLKMAAAAGPIFLEHGALRVVECWGDAVPEGKVTDFRRAVQAEEGENVVFSWILWPDKATREAGQAKVMADPRMDMDGQEIPFDGKRMIYGGFAPIFDTED